MPQHLSARIPWKDNGYAGLVCDKPCYNNCCLRLKNIAESRDDSYETELAGTKMGSKEDKIPCLSEGGCFMSEESYTRVNVHPYKEHNKKTHGHFLETELRFPSFSYPARPFGWTMLRKGQDKNDSNIRRLVDRTGMNYDPDREPDLGFNTNWVQDAENQREIFHTFFEDVILGESLIIPYAKQVPFVDEARRVVMGIGVVESITEPPEHNHTNEGELRSILWETMLGHSIRDDRKDGFMLPYREMMKYAEEHPEFDIRSITVFADDEYFEEFSYATEWVSHDAVISVLLRIIQVLEIIRDCIPGNWGECIKWTKRKLEEVWKDRGTYPGLGSMLSAVGIPRGEVVAKEIKKHIKDDGEYEAVLTDSLKKPKKYYSDKVLSVFSKTDAEAFCALDKNRKELFWLLARMTISSIQGESVFYPESRKKHGIAISDDEIIENPYFLYELTLRMTQEYAIGVKTIDMALLTPAFVKNRAPLPEKTRLESDNDRKRIRAYLMSLLELYAISGHTVYPVSFLIEELNHLPIDPPCRVTSDIVSYMSDYLEEKLYPIECKNEEKAYQLQRLYEMDEVIRSSVSARLKGTRHDVPEDWRKIIDHAFPEKKGDFEDKAREEKAAILKELAESRISVLTGGAGTGKTTLLALLCKSKKIQNGGILLLAPTGKARVRMSQAMRQQGVTATAKTVAQFLSESKRFNGLTMEYRLSNEIAKEVPDTVIIDESSMLTEEMFAALLEALKKNAKRIIFVGDQNQLPPIGAGRPFVDLVNHLKSDKITFPRVTKGFGELTVTMRQVSMDGNIREDMELAKWYTENPENLDENIFIDLQGGRLGDNVVFKAWSTAEELEDLLFKSIAEETEMSDMDDVEGFNLSLGGMIENGWMNFGKHPEKIEDWQILSAYRNDSVSGTATINRYIHERYRFDKMQTLKNSKIRGTKHILGNDGIVYGDKVINVRNHRRLSYPKEQQLNYVANGEVGVVERLWEQPKSKWNQHQVRFSSQPDCSYTWGSYIPTEGNSDLELAYALTVHKAQGSEFEKAILILGEPGKLLSKEMLYTAITRQKEKLIILYNDEAYHLRDYSMPDHSEVAKRFTCLFEMPDIVEHEKIYFERSLIHKTLRGELVRSKSEVIIANMLYEAGLDYEYEKELNLDEDGKRIPDFSFEDAESGLCIYWEHCGMLGDRNYRERWEEKKKIYEKHGIVEGNNLIVTEDAMNGGIDSSKILKKIEWLKTKLKNLS